MSVKIGDFIKFKGFLVEFLENRRSSENKKKNRKSPKNVDGNFAGIFGLSAFFTSDLKSMMHTAWWGFKRCFFKQILGYLRNKALFLRFLDFPGAFGSSGKGEKSRKRAKTVVLLKPPSVSSVLLRPHRIYSPYRNSLSVVF